VLTYTLSAITALLGLSTLWLACGTLARDIEDCTLQVVAIKPIARWQIWLGKWLGLVSLNAALLTLSGASVYGLLQWRATRLPADQQKILRSEVLVARGSAKPASMEKEILAETDRILRERLQKNPDTRANVAEARKQILDQVKAELQVVPPGWAHEWEIDLGPAKDIVRGQPVYLAHQVQCRRQEHHRHVRRALAGRQAAQNAGVAQRSDEPGTGHLSRVRSPGSLRR